MKKLFLFIALTQACFLINAQETLYGIEQIAGTESLVKDRLTETGATGDYTFSVLLPVGGCPRCEGSIPLFFNDTKKYFPEVYNLIIALSDNPQTAENNISTKNYGTNNIICVDNDDPLMQSFNFKTGSAGVPYIVIINNNTGDFINASPLLGISYDLDFFQSLTENLETVKVDKISVKTNTNKFHSSISPSIIKLKSLENKSYNINCSTLPTVSNITLSKDLSKLALLEFETSSVLLSEKRTDQYVFTDTIKTTESEYYLFKAPDVPDSLVQALRFLNVMQIIYLDIAFSDNAEELLISASLPKLYWEDIVTEKLVYTNEACLIRYNLKEKSKTINPMQLDSLYITSHSHFYIDEEKQRIFMGILKGWPTQGTTAEPTSTDTDPFIDSFYDFSPMMSVLTYPQCTFSQYLGELPSWHKKEHSGYFYFSPKVCFDKNHYVVADTHTGEITTFDRNSLKQISTFNINDLLLKKGLLVKNDTITYSLQPNSKLQRIIDKKELLSSRILDVAYNKNTYYVLLTDEKNVILYICFPEINKLMSTDYIAPSFIGDINKMKLLYQNGEIKVISIVDNSGKVSLNTMTFTH